MSLIRDTLLRDCSRKVYEVKNDKNGVLPEDTVSRIKELAERWDIVLPDDFDWNWYDKKTGTRISSRLSKLHHQQNAVEILNGLSFKDSLSYQASLWKNSFLDKDNYYIDFNDTLDWESGDYGNRGSCLWGSMKRCRHAMQDDGYGAMRLLKVSRDVVLTGQGRMWLCPDQPFDGWFVLFNAYGWGNWLRPGTICELFLRQILGWDYSAVYSDSLHGNRWYVMGDGFIVGPTGHVHDYCREKDDYYQLRKKGGKKWLLK